MTLPEANEILEEERSEHHSFSTDRIGQAIQIGSEALTLVEHLQSYPGLKELFKLPSQE